MHRPGFSPLGFTCTKSVKANILRRISAGRRRKRFMLIELVGEEEDEEEEEKGGGGGSAWEAMDGGQNL